MFSDALLADLYEFTMAEGYLEHGKADDTAVFDLYFRHNPFRGGYAVAAGLEDAVRAVTGMKFGTREIDYLRSLQGMSKEPLFREPFLEYLSGFRFRGNLWAVPEGTVVFPHEPLLQVCGGLIECQIVESILLNHINFQTLIATKAARIWEASRHGTIVEFGLRRAAGPESAVHACRAAHIGGADATSNVKGAALFGIAPTGTHAHSWVQSFPSELEAFRAYAHSFRDNCVLLVDTYDVLESGLPNAIRVAREMQEDGHDLFGIRLDSGDLAFLSKRAREMLDQAGLNHVKIVASNELDEFVISDILVQGGRIDIWGVGTRLVTGSGEGGCALGGVYKMVEHNGHPKIKLNSNPEKMTNPGFKRVIRIYGRDGLMEADVMARRSEEVGENEVWIIDPNNPLRRKKLNGGQRTDLLCPILENGRQVCDFPSLKEIRLRRADQLSTLHESYRRLNMPHEYKVGLTPALWRQKEMMFNQEMV